MEKLVYYWLLAFWYLAVIPVSIAMVLAITGTVIYVWVYLIVAAYNAAT